MAVVIVTGCSSGFGEGIALKFAERGDRVIATMRNPAKAADALRNHAQIDVEQLDVTDSASRDRLIALIMERYGRIDILVNNAGIVAKASYEDTSDEISRKLFETNYFAPVALMQKVLPIMREQRGGRIVNVTAIGAIVSTPLLGPYCATKHALDCASAVIDIEGRLFGVRAPSVLPGPFHTPIVGNSLAQNITPTYQSIENAMQKYRDARPGYVSEDLSPVINAVLAAATDPEPKARYLVGAGVTRELDASVAELERLQIWDAGRSGFE